MNKKPLLIRNASQMVTLAGSSDAPLTGKQMEQLQIIENGSVWLEDGVIQFVGKDEEVAQIYKDRLNEAEIIDATGKLVTPGLVDPHTHLVFAGSRENEFNMRLEGATYMEIMNNGGGIHATTSATRKATHQTLFEESKNVSTNSCCMVLRQLKQKADTVFHSNMKSSSWKWRESFMSNIRLISFRRSWGHMRFLLNIRKTRMSL